MIERFFRDLSEERLRRGVFTSVSELIEAVDSVHRHTQPKTQAIHLDSQG